MSGSVAKPVFGSPIQRRSIRDTVTAALRSAIVSGEMAPGRLYSAPMLSEQFGVSATPVRESMLDLAKEGLVVPVPNKGFRVTEFTDRELDEIAQLRGLLEPPSIRQVAALIREDDFPTLRQLAVETVRAAEAGDLVAYLDADRTLHLQLLAYTENQRLLELVSELRARSRLFGLKKLAEEGQLVASANEHHALLDAIESRDAVAAEAIMVQHINHVRRDWS